MSEQQEPLWESWQRVDDWIERRSTSGQWEVLEVGYLNALEAQVTAKDRVALRVIAEGKSGNPQRYAQQALEDQ